MDWGRIAALFHVIEKARGYPQLKHIHDRAMKELEETKVEEKEAKAVAADAVTRRKIGEKE